MKKYMPNFTKLFIVLLVLLGGTAHWSVDTTQAQNSVGKENVESQLLIEFENIREENDIKSFLNSLQPEVETVEIEEINVMKVQASSAKQKELIEKHLKQTFHLDSDQLGDEERVTLETSAERVPMQTVQTNSMSFLRNAQWDIEAVTNNGESHHLQKGSHDVKIGLIDSGVDFQHPDLMKNIVGPGKSFVPGIEDTQDVLGHGTMVAGAIAADGEQIGVGPELGIVPYKVFHDGSADSFWIIQAIVEAANDGMDVINLSLGTYKSPKNKEDKMVIKAYEKAVKYAKKHGVFVVASAGSSGYDISRPFDQNEDIQDVIHLPGGMKDVFTVAATTKENTMASYSNYGKNVDMGAPGGDYGVNFKEEQVFDIQSMILTTYPIQIPQSIFATYLGIPQGYDFSAGSSLASPKVAATAGLIIEEYKDKHGKKPSLNKIEKTLIKGAEENETARKNKQFKHGIVNAYQSLQLVK
ncbi:S8 family serine peptidase [Rossellomorea aquimaris]|uniref:Subtilase family protein n=1 Tax=Rossellomorea aquimaris TaxID=189382 RepID=A0A366EJC4_9BACI|nr:S8 family serine peptidase [Rossellomorea aquimaris]RBP02483.1 subtilase family protein [Rossellomorea aquimaris]